MRTEEALQTLKTDLHGLDEKEARRRLDEYGPNELLEKKKISPIKIFLGQFKDFLVIILLIATLISALLGELLDASAIAIILILNAVLGFTQEYRAEKSMEALKKLAAPKAHVIRGGKEIEIPTMELVPGDIVILRTGDAIPADLRLIEAINLEVDEAVLTGESIPVKKDTAAILETPRKLEEEEEASIPVAERTNMAFMSTHATYGRGKGVIVATGMSTEVGKIAEMIQAAPPKETPLQIKLGQFGKQIGLGVLLISVIVFLAEILRPGAEDILKMFIFAVSLAVAAIPEGLPAIVTLTLAIGVLRMAKRSAIIRKLPEVETLGCATVICSDKTGTLTKGEMTVRKVFTSNQIIDVTGSGFELKGEFRRGDKAIEVQEDENVSMTLKIGALCNDSNLRVDEKGALRVDGDPTEGALIVAARKAGMLQDSLKEQYLRIGECSFSSERKRMTTIHKTFDGKKVAYMKGATEVVLELCTHIYLEGQVKELSQKERETILEINQKMASEALRVLAMAYKSLPETLQDFSSQVIEKNMVFVGLIGMIDPPREEAKHAIRVCEQAGIKVIMITGDHKHTAVSVAKELSLIKDDPKVLTGAELDALSDEDFERIVEDVVVYARVSPEHKMKIIKALKDKGEIVAMTGDGVNDAPALKNADIGVAMGITGTDVTKEASDMVLADDNFATIVAAVEEGRSIYSNIRKSIQYLLSSNAGEVLTVFVAALLGFPPPLLALQLLWINLVTDGAPALALGVDPADLDTMKKPPRPPEERVFSKVMVLAIIGVSILMCVGTLTTFALGGGVLFSKTEAPRRALTLAFTTMVMFEMFNVFNCRSERHSIFKVGAFANKYLIVAVVSSILLQIAAIYVPLFQPIFKTEPLSIFDWLVVTLISSTVLIAIEIGKFFANRMNA